MAIKFEELPYALEALEPYISSKTLSFHHGKHHKTYVDKLNGLIANTPLDSMSLEEIIKVSSNKDSYNYSAPIKGVYNNACQAFNHNFYWKSIKPQGGGAPTPKAQQVITELFGDMEKMKQTFKDEAAARCGSGWLWLYWDGKQVKFQTTSDADTPLANGYTPLITIDIWEHAYYLDYQNRRVDYIDMFLNYLINWEFFEENLSKVS